MGVDACIWRIEIPRGRTASVIIWACPTDTYTWRASSADSGTGNSVVIGRLCTTYVCPEATHQSMSWGDPIWPSI